MIFDEDHEMFRDSVRRFMLSEAAPHVEQWREDGCCDPDIFLKAGEQGLLCMWADEKYGGLGIEDFRFEQVVIEETIRHGDIGLFMSLHSRLVGPYIGHLGSEELKARLLPKCISGETILGIAMTEPNAGSDLAGIKSKAVRDGDDWILSGSKTFISNGINGGAFVVAARTVPDKPHGIGLFVVESDMEGFSRGRNLKKMGLKAQDTAELFFENVRIPAANVLGDPEKGFYSLMHHLAEERLISACQEVAHAQVAFDLTMDYILERKAFGKPIGAFQNSRFKMAEMRTSLDILQKFPDMFHPIIYWIALFALFALLTNLIREIIKDAEDIAGDKEVGSKTIAVVYGIKTSKFITFILALITFVGLVAIFLFYLSDWMSLTYFGVFLAAPFLLLLFQIRKINDSKGFHRLSLLIKIIMLTGLMYAPIAYFVMNVIIS